MKLKNLITICLTVFIVMQGFNSMAQQDGVKPNSFSKAVYFDRVGPLIDFPALTQEELMEMDEKEKNKVRNKDLQYRSYPNAASALPKGPDAVWQKQVGKMRGVSNIMENFNGLTTTSSPPDCNGSAGPEHFFQTVNVKYSIYDKGGNQVVAPTNLNTLFSGVTGANNNDGDPILLYDDNADRWLAAEFSGVYTSPYYMMIAISVTNDPTGDWYRWSWTMNGFPDYMKFGVWEDGYYMGTNTSSGNDIYVFEREEMLIGGTAPQMVQFNNNWRPSSGFHCVLPADCDGDYAPEGTPGMFLTINDDAWGGGGDELWVFELDVDWDTPSNSTWNRTQQISVSPFDSNFGSSWDNIKQKGTGQELDAINQVLMYRVQYRNFGSEQRIVCNHTVDVDNTDHAGIRWYELEKDGDTWQVRQEGTYAPDEHSRWMGSIAMNGSKDIALGYSISSNNIYPGIRYCGQSSLENAAASGIMDIEEGIIKEGTASQSGTNRWGDYSNMSIDPEDDETFWYTTQYMSSSSSKASKVASIYFEELLAASFSANPSNVFVGGSVTFTDLSVGEPTEWQWIFEGGDPASSTEQSPIVTYNTAGTYDVSLTVSNSQGSNTMVKEDYINVTDEILSIDPSSLTVSADAGSSTVALTSNRGWDSSEDCDWLSISPTSGFSGGNILIEYDENTGIQRECVITFFTENNTLDFIVTQTGVAEVLTLDPVSATVDYLSTTFDVTVGSNTSWSVAESCEWLNVSPESGEGNATLTIGYDENVELESRECIIVVSSDNLSVDFTLTQTGYPALITTDILTETVSSEASTVEVEVTSNVEWTASEQCDWYSVSPSSGNGVTMVTITYDENTSFEESRSCIVNFTGSGAGAGFELIQQSKIAILDLSKENEDVNWEAGNLQVDVTTNTDWEISNNCEWITVDPASGSLSGSFVLSYLENSETNERNCTVSVTGGGLVEQLTINQTGHPDGIDELTANQISLYPNPATNSFNIVSKKAIDNIKIVDALGNTVTEYKNPGTDLLIGTSNWDRGTYFVLISLNNTIINGTVIVK
jgi:PKD repeat protein